MSNTPPPNINDMIKSLKDDSYAAPAPKAAEPKAEAKGGPALDVKQLVNNSGQTYSVDELSKKGFKQIQVLEKNAFNNLLQEAVDRVLAMHGSVLSHDERQRVMEETKMELRLLAQENDMVKEKSSRDRDSLLRETENLHQQLIMHRKLSQEQDRVRFDEGVRSLQPVVDQLRIRVKELETEVASLRAAAAAAPRPDDGVAEAAARKASEDLARRLSEQAAAQAAQMAQMQAKMEEQFMAMQQAANARKGMDAADLDRIQATIDSRLKATPVEDTAAIAARKAAEELANKTAAQMAQMQAKMEEQLQAMQQAASARKGMDAADLDRISATIDSRLKSVEEATKEAARARPVEDSSLAQSLNQMQAMLDARLQAVEAAANQKGNRSEAVSDAVAQMQLLLDQRLKSVEMAADRKDADSAALAESMLAMQAQMEARIGALQQQASASKNEKANADLEKMMMRLGDTLGRKISALKSGEDNSAAAEYRPSEATMQSMLKTDGIESNLSTLDTKKEVAKGASTGAMARLRALQGGKKDEPAGSPPPPPASNA